MGLYNWMLEYRWGPVKTDLAAESERIRRQIREAKERRKENGTHDRPGPDNPGPGCDPPPGPPPALYGSRALA